VLCGHGTGGPNVPTFQRSAHPGKREVETGAVTAIRFRGRYQFQRQMPGAVVRVFEAAVVTSGSFKKGK